MLIVRPMAVVLDWRSFYNTTDLLNLGSARLRGSTAAHAIRFPGSVALRIIKKSGLGPPCQWQVRRNERAAGTNDKADARVNGKQEGPPIHQPWDVAGDKAQLCHVYTAFTGFFVTNALKPTVPCEQQTPQNSGLCFA